MSFKGASWAGAAAAVVLAMGGMASAAPVVDVDNYRAFNEPGGIYQIGTSYQQALGRDLTTTLLQTWTVGQAGTLAGIDIFGEVSGGAPIHLDVFAGGTSNTPSLNPAFFLGQVTGSHPVAGPGQPLFYPIAFDLSPLKILGAVGDRFTFQVRVDTCDDCDGTQLYTYLRGDLTTVPVYAGGAMFLRQGAALVKTDLDANFRTFMTPATAPEPATWALLILGFGVAGAALRRPRDAAASFAVAASGEVQDPALEL